MYSEEKDFLFHHNGSFVRTAATRILPVKKLLPIAIASSLAGPAVADALPKAGLYCAPYGYGVPISFQKDGSAGIDGLDCGRVTLSKGTIQSKKCYANGGSVVTLNEKFAIRPDGSIHFNDVVYKYIGVGKLANDCPGTPESSKALVRPGATAANGLETPEAAFRELIAFDRYRGNDVIFNRRIITPAMKRHLSSSLAKDWVAAGNTGENVLDAEVFSGRQSTTKANTYQQIKLISNDGRTAKVQAVLRVTIDDIAHLNKQNFLFVKQDGTWKLDDIQYTPDFRASNTLHAIARSFLPGGSNRSAAR
ncbi:MAG: hypothetical protein EKK49_11805 [Rhodocyclaceae bacterium]|nr:MAG: hypothetical protein EKK49_11805 [Rhodocyclaceae bacterium]